MRLRLPHRVSKEINHSQDVLLWYTHWTTVPAVCWWAANLTRCQFITVQGQLHRVFYIHVCHVDNFAAAVLPSQTSSVLTRFQQLASTQIATISAKHLSWVLSPYSHNLLLYLLICWYHICLFRYRGVSLLIKGRYKHKDKWKRLLYQHTEMRLILVLEWTMKDLGEGAVFHCCGEVPRVPQNLKCCVTWCVTASRITLSGGTARSAQTARRHPVESTTGY